LIEALEAVPYGVFAVDRAGLAAVMSLGEADRLAYEEALTAVRKVLLAIKVTDLELALLELPLHLVGVLLRVLVEVGDSFTIQSSTIKLT